MPAAISGRYMNGWPAEAIYDYHDVDVNGHQGGVEARQLGAHNIFSLHTPAPKRLHRQCYPWPVSMAPSGPRCQHLRPSPLQSITVYAASEKQVNPFVSKRSRVVGEEVPPKISVVSAVYNVEDYIGEYLDSLDRQTTPSTFEVILVLDGSTDSSERIVREWAEQTALSHSILTKVNGGQASARNVGIREAHGEWITFCDPDDYLAEDYFENLTAFMEKDPSNHASMYATRVVGFDEASGTVSASHPLNGRFRDGNRFVSLERSPSFFHMSGATAVVRSSELKRLGHEFQEELTFSFEDAHFVAAYLLQQPEPVIGVVANSDYFYRRRAAGNSSVQTSAFKEEKYGAVLSHGHLDLLARAKAISGRVPMWLQLMLIYDLLWYYRGDRRVGAPSRRMDTAVLENFHKLVTEVMGDISEIAIHSFEVMPTDNDLRNALILGYKKPEHRPQEIYVEKLDIDQQMTLLHYVYSGSMPEETITYKGKQVIPRHAKTRTMTFLGKTLFSHRYIWIPADGTFDVALDGVQRQLIIGRPRREHYSLRPYTVSKALAGVDLTRPTSIPRTTRSKYLPVRAVRKAQRIGMDYRQRLLDAWKMKSDEERKLLRLADTPKVKAKYRNSWIFMDRIYRANDNAEHLYRHISNKYPRVNTWFVLDRHSPDWDRLSAGGFKLLEHGSEDHKLALMNAKIYASSHLDKFVTDPLSGLLASRARWKFVFLQHGVTDHDLSYWFNTKSIDLLVTSTVAEHESIVGNDTAYRFSTKEVKLTGFPRHDALASRSTRPAKQWILVSPTWRQSLVGPSDSLGRRGRILGFAESDYALSWGAFLRSPELVRFAEDHGLRIGLLPHPSLAEYVSEMDLSPDVSVLDWDDKPFAEFVHESAVLVTDYSSTAFEAAYCGVPVVYYQFDQEAIKAGSHTYDVGYFDFEDHGFGPVTVDADTAVAATVTSIAGDPDPKFAALTKLTFKYVDAGNSERVYREMTKLIRPARLKEIIQ
ncbi:bifunctional glycosyltransferase/CDP-glycerol:glycerophosphate glycerophosphotransferase [Paeniglutamicibacter psychrophenolicus]|uniref:bifunctional glycosyltransferase/CDP-glycerol:glycerophosphate glycerophosphotransferase n=1 Tax=Paeniglutamicibacter psychrophenolicus TaxID=257454 RepID=UPI00278A9919|nr:glycosyltransferase [Paeniglutamicibacter psychrophenolicus]MDQ0096137.1 glycosyltransferase involved in cell wall biosynthesis [Paeniglutamicibacter psychrophenolicus]